MIKKLIIAAAILSGAAHAQTKDLWVVHFDGGKAKVLESSVRTYTNSNQVKQSDALVDLTSDKGDFRVRMGVTGCGTSYGQIGRVDLQGNVIQGTVKEWAEDGTRVYDILAIMICVAGEPKAKPTQKRPST